MAFDWGGYLRLGRTLSNDCATDGDGNSKEAKRRSAISRAYYSAFHVAKKYLDERYGIKTGTHGFVWATLQERERNEDEKDAGRDGDRLYRVRRRADYEDIYKDPEKDTKLALEQARNICQKLGRKI